MYLFLRIFWRRVLLLCGGRSPGPAYSDRTYPSNVLAFLFKDSLAVLRGILGRSEQGIDRPGEAGLVRRALYPRHRLALA